MYTFDVDIVRQRVTTAIGRRIDELGLTAADVATMAGVDPTTVRAFVKGERWPHPATRHKIARALGWDEEEIARQAVDGDEQVLRNIPTDALIAELHRRVVAGEM